MPFVCIYTPPGITLQQNKKISALFLALFSLSKKSVLPAKRAFEIRFLPRVSRGKKHFYPHKCAVCRHSRQTVRAGRMFGGKVTLLTFSTVSKAPFSGRLFQISTSSPPPIYISLSPSISSIMSKPLNPVQWHAYIFSALLSLSARAWDVT